MMKRSQSALRLLVLLWPCSKSMPLRATAGSRRTRNPCRRSKTEHDAELAMSMVGLVENNVMRI